MDFFSFLFWIAAISILAILTYNLFKMGHTERIEEGKWERELKARTNAHNDWKARGVFHAAPQQDDSGDSGVKSDSSVLGSTDASFESSSEKTRLFEFDSK